MFRKLLRLEGRISLRCLPALLGALAFFSLLLTLLLYTLSHLLYENEAPARAAVAIVSLGEQNEEYMEMGMRYLSGMSSTSLALDFKDMEEEDARQALRKGEVIAIALLPDHIIEGVLYGNADPVRIIFSDDGGLSSVLLKELTASGMIMLSAAESSSYTTGWLYRAEGLDEKLSKALTDVDGINITHVVNREKLFTESGTLPLFLSYIATALALLLAFSHTVMAPALRRRPHAFYQLLVPARCSSITYFSVRALTNTLLFFLVELLIFPAAALLPEGSLPFLISTDSILLLFFGAALLTVMQLFLQQLFSEGAAVLVHLLFSVAALFCAGAILPAAFLPRALVSAGNLLPLPLFREGLMNVMNGEGSLPLLPMLGWILVFFFAACAVFRFRREAVK